ncbi:MAG: N-acetyltransferase family protein [Pseudomonadota bacterium]
MTAIIRTARAEDAAGIAPIYNQIIRDTTITFLPDEKTVDDLVAAIEAADAYLVAEHGSEIVAFASFGPFRSGAGYARVKEHSICLAQQARGHGLGAALMKALEDAARAQGVRVLVAGISGENDAAQRFHTRLGYVQVGHLPEIGDKFGRPLDLVLMQKSL